MIARETGRIDAWRLQWKPGTEPKPHIFRDSDVAKWIESASYYCAGHLMEAAVAYYQATGKRKMLDVIVRYADHIDARFGPGKHAGTSGHPEIELALVKLYRAPGEMRVWLRAAE